MDLSKEAIEKHLNSLSDKRQKIDSMNHYASFLFQQNEPYAAWLADEALVQSRSSGYLRGAGFALLNKGVHCAISGDYQTMIGFLQEAETIIRGLKEREPKGLAKVLTFKAVYLLNMGDYSEAAVVFNEAVPIAIASGDPDLLGNINCKLSVLYNAMGQNQKALDCCIEALGLLENTGDFRILVNTLNNAGCTCFLLKEYPRALAFLEKALSIIKEKGLDYQEPAILESLSEVYQELKEYGKAEKLLKRSLKLAGPQHNYREELTALHQLGILYLAKGDHTRAGTYLERTLVYSEKHSLYLYVKEIHDSLKKLALINNDYKKAFYHLEQYQKAEKRAFDREIDIRMRKFEAESLREANRRIKTISSIGKEITARLDLNKVLDLVYEKINSIMEAAVFGIAHLSKDKKRIEYDMFVEEGEHLNTFYCSIEDKKSVAVLAIREKRDIMVNDMLVEYPAFLSKSQDYGDNIFGGDLERMPLSVICCPLIISGEVTGVIMVQSYKKSAYSLSDLDAVKVLASYAAIALANANKSEFIRKQNSILQETNKQLEMTMDELRKKNKLILSSIGYAQRIQSSILPPFSIVKEYFNDSFLLYQPRDIVGGDFYWFRKVHSGLLCIIGDCTGHGVPGALMVMTVNTLLTKINDDNFYDNPALLLADLNRLLKKTLKQEDENSDSLSDDGADMAVCFICPKKARLFFAGANLSLYYTEGQKVHEAEGDRMSIGYKKSISRFSFTNREFPLVKGRAFYLTTDGYKDQTGGEKGFPLGRENFKNILKNMEARKMTEQKEKLKSEITAYLGEEKQIDDITVLGFRV